MIVWLGQVSLEVGRCMLEKDTVKVEMCVLLPGQSCKCLQLSTKTKGMDKRKCTQKCAVVDVSNAPCGYKVQVGMCRMIGARSRAE